VLTALALVLVAGALLATAVVAAVRAAFDALGNHRARDLAADGVRGGAALVGLVERPGRTRASLSLTEGALLVGSGGLGALAGRRLGDLGLAVLTVVVVGTLAVVAHVVGATVGARRAAGIASRLARPVAAWSAAIGPIWRLLSALASILLGRAGLRGGPYDPGGDDAPPDQDALEEEELLHSVSEFGDTLLHSVMTPRTDMTVLACSTTVSDAIDVLIVEGYSRVPCYDDDVDHIQGLLILKDLVRAARDGDGALEVRALIRPAVFVPEQKRVAELLREMRTRRFHMAIVVDEYGGTAGLVTIEDLLEELVGEIGDEFDDEDDEQLVEVLDARTVRVAGRMPIAELNELLGTDFEDTEWDTLGGLVLHLLGRLPDVGESRVHRGVRLVVDRLQGRRVTQVRLHLPEARPDLLAQRVGS
jgi:putative hemolysin